MNRAVPSLHRGPPLQITLTVPYRKIIQTFRLIFNFIFLGKIEGKDGKKESVKILYYHETRQIEDKMTEDEAGDGTPVSTIMCR